MVVATSPLHTASAGLSSIVLGLYGVGLSRVHVWQYSSLETP